MVCFFYSFWFSLRKEKRASIYLIMKKFIIISIITIFLSSCAVTENDEGKFRIVIDAESLARAIKILTPNK